MDSNLLTEAQKEKRVKEARITWYHARNTFLGLNGRVTHLPNGIKFAEECRDYVEDARWLCDIYRGNPNQQMARLRTEALTVGDGRSLFFMGSLASRYLDRMRYAARASELGYAPAHAWLAEQIGAIDLKGALELALRAVRQDDPRGHYVVWELTHNVERLDEFQEKPEYHLRRAAELGDCTAMATLASLQSTPIPEQSRLMALAAKYGYFSTAIRMVLNDNLELFIDGVGPYAHVSKCLFQCGQVWSGHVFDNDSPYENAFWLPQTAAAVELYLEWCEKTRMSIVAWILCCRSKEGQSIRVSRDIRMLIAKLVWSDREEASYPLDETRARFKTSLALSTDIL